jgi:SAM-dependent methyltransferase
MPEVTRTSYDEIEYISRPFPQAHPDSMAALANLYGLNPPDPATARVLDIGCGSGGHIVPLAAALPGGSFFGFDLAATAISAAQSWASEVDVTSNLRLETLDILDFPEDAGEFDYIIAHGFYSWVPGPARDAFWRLVQRHLSPDGIVYVSFNAYPGAMFRHIWRDAGLFHARGIEDPHARTAKAAEMLDLLAGAAKKREPLQSIMDEMRSAIATKGLAWASHDDFGEYFQPFYFHQVAEEAAKHSLYFLSDAVHTDSQAHGMNDKGMQVLQQVGSRSAVYREQYYDFLELRPFRQILLTRHGAPDQPQRQPDIQRLRDLRFRSRAEVTGSSPDGLYRLTDPVTKVSVDAPGPYKDVVTQLRDAWPNALEFRRIAPHRPGRGDVANVLHSLWAVALASAHAAPVECGDGKSTRPVAWKIARQQAAAGQPVTTRLHVQEQIDAKSARLLAKLDGTRTRSQLSLEFDELPGRLRWLADKGLLDPEPE